MSKRTNSAAGIFFFKQKTAYEMRISDWSSDVCSSDLRKRESLPRRDRVAVLRLDRVDGVEPPLDAVALRLAEELRSEERRVGKERVSTCRSRWSPYH